MRVNLRRDLDLDTLMPTLPVRAVALASWRLEDQWVTAVRLTQLAPGGWITLDPRMRKAISSPPPSARGAGARSRRDMTVLYLVLGGRGLARSLLPRDSPLSTLPCICRSRTATRTPGGRHTQ
ncbi:DUF3438 family protein [Pseudomonas aeruginosa]|uniref:DUF3438 family protein n=1 Tax=Pseudomonas aeruginosa TaxID=287 RepID=UPI00259D16A4|nr:DUF3438 family protein [Pseudomonas aeruginosa]MDM5017720.1 DUF3438 family protein [Pseudomonas aeruginosa]